MTRRPSANLVPCQRCGRPTYATGGYGDAQYRKCRGCGHRFKRANPFSRLLASETPTSA